MRVVKLYRSSVGKKIVMAVTGVILIAFVVVHMLGNLKVYLGPEAYNAYAEGLRTFGEPFLPRTYFLWIVRVVLLLCVGLHILSAAQLWWQSKQARRQGYGRYDAVVFSYASRTMVWGGLIIVAFVIFHLLDLTFGTVNPGFIPGNAYHNFVATFRRWPVSLAYVAAMIPLGLHLYHGFWSMLQTLGVNNPRYNPYRRPTAAVLAIVIVLGNISFPLAVLAGIVG